MEILGIGPMELILILIVALMVFGPDKLPQMGAKLGRAMREMRKATRAIKDEVNSTREAIENPARELAEPFKEVAGLAKAAGTVAAAARNPGAALRESILKELNPPTQSAAQAGQPVEAGAMSTDGPVEENRIAPPDLAASESPVEGAVPFVPTLLPPVVAAPNESENREGEASQGDREAPLQTPDSPDDRRGALRSPLADASSSPDAAPSAAPPPQTSDTPTYPPPEQ